MNPSYDPVNLANPIAAGAFSLQFILAQGARVKRFTAKQNAVQLKHMIPGLAVGAAALPTGIGVDHPANRCPVGS
ncbi:hypothetical protein D3C84_1255260 [compost metagenome]